MSSAINNLTSAASGAMPRATKGLSGSSGDFADTFSKYLDEVNKLQSDASQAVQAVTTGQTDDLAGVMTAMEKSDVAFKTLLAIRTKLLDAYEELRNMPI